MKKLWCALKCKVRSALGLEWIDEAKAIATEERRRRGIEDTWRRRERP